MELINVFPPLLTPSLLKNCIPPYMAHPHHSRPIILQKWKAMTSCQIRRRFTLACICFPISQNLLLYQHTVSPIEGMLTGRAAVLLSALKLEAQVLF